MDVIYLDSYIVYVNNYRYSHLNGAAYYGDRPEFHREHEKELWTLYQLVKSNNLITITTLQKKVLYKIATTDQFKMWVKHEYHNFVDTIENDIYTKYPDSSCFLDD